MTESLSDARDPGVGRKIGDQAIAEGDSGGHRNDLPETHTVLGHAVDLAYQDIDGKRPAAETSAKALGSGLSLQAHRARQHD